MIRALACLAACCAPVATPARTTADPAPFETLFETLVETDTTLATGSCTAAAGKMAAAMSAADFPAEGLHPYASPGHPAEGGLVAILRGADPSAEALLLVAHIDVVPADPPRWTYDPWTLTKAGGYYYGRGVADDKAMAAALVDTLIRLHRGGYRPRGDVKIALTCGEEDATAFNGARYLATERRALIDAALVIVPSGGATLDGRGRPVSLSIQAGEKAQQNFRLTATGATSHASRPLPDNAIYTLARALLRVAAHRFPVALNPAARRYFERAAATAEPAKATAIRALLADPSNTAAQAIVTADPAWNGMLRTTCVATVVETGKQLNTVQAEAAANLNCRLLPGVQVGDVERVLTALVADPAIRIDPVLPIAESSVSPPLDAELLDTVTRVARRSWPGVSVVPTMLTGATDARHFNAVGMPAYGLTALFYDPDGNGVHAADERIEVRSLAEGRAFVEALIRALDARR